MHRFWHPFRVRGVFVLVTQGSLTRLRRARSPWAIIPRPGGPVCIAGTEIPRPGGSVCRAWAIIPRPGGPVCITGDTIM